MFYFSFGLHRLTADRRIIGVMIIQEVIKGDYSGGNKRELFWR